MTLSLFLSHHGIVLGILALVLMITVHELGHFIVARAAGICVYEFSLGFGPTLYEKIDKNGMKWSIRAFPIGGFVHMLENNTIFAEEEDGAELMEAYIGIENVSLGWQIAVLLAGITANVLFAAVCFSASMMVGFDTDLSKDAEFNVFLDSSTWVVIDKEELLRLSRNTRVVVASLDAEGLLAEVGVQAGDTILAVDGVPVESPEDATDRLAPDWRGQDFVIQFSHEGDVSSLGYLPEYLDDSRSADEYAGECSPAEEVPWTYYDEEYTLSTVGTVALPFPKAIVLGAAQTIDGMWLSVSLTADALLHLFSTPKETVDGMMGPVGCVVMMDAFAVHGMALFLQIAGVVSLGIAATNLVPLPVVDGGQVIFIFIRKVFGKYSFYDKAENVLGWASIVILVVFGIGITVRDIVHLF